MHLPAHSHSTTFANMSAKASFEAAVEPSSASQSDVTTPSPSTGFRKGSAFWLTFIAVLVCTFVSALDLTAVSIALPTITESLNGGSKFVWIGSAYGLSSAAILPLSGRLADAFGRRPVMLAFVGLFLIGSALAGASQNMDMLIAARSESSNHLQLPTVPHVPHPTAVQGIGSGGILNLSEIIVSDLVPLAERGMFMGIISSVWAIASGMGPPIVSVAVICVVYGALIYLVCVRVVLLPRRMHGVGFSVSSRPSAVHVCLSDCRIDVNLPLTGIAFILVLLFLRVRTPPRSIGEKLSRLDIVYVVNGVFNISLCSSDHVVLSGNVIIIAGTTLALIGLIWGGVAYAWTSAHTLTTLVIGLVLMGAFFVYEWLVPQDPSIPWEVVGNRTTVSAYVPCSILSPQRTESATAISGRSSTASHPPPCFVSNLGAYRVRMFLSSRHTDYLPVYFQACMGSSPLRSSVQGLPTALVIAPFAFVAGTLVQIVQKYRWANVLAWCLALVGFGLFSTLDASSTMGKWVGFQIVLAAAIGLLVCTQGVLPSHLCRRLT